MIQNRVPGILLQAIQNRNNMKVSHESEARRVYESILYTALSLGFCFK